MDLALNGNISVVIACTAAIGVATATERARLGAGISVNGRAQAGRYVAVSTIEAALPGGDALMNTSGGATAGAS